MLLPLDSLFLRGSGVLIAKHPGQSESHTDGDSGHGSLIMGGLYSTTVVAGIHHMYTVIDMGQLSMYGVTYWLPLASAANMAGAFR
mgnify:CR=1 FL=1